MKHMKRTLSIALAMIMALGLLTVSAYATESTGNTKSTTPLTSIPVTKTVEILQGASIPSETFTFTITPATTSELTTSNNTAVQVSGQTVKAGIALGDDNNTVTYSFDSKDNTSAAAEADANGTSTTIVTKTVGTTSKTYADVKKTGQSFDLSTVTFPSGGIYRYYVTENGSSTETDSAAAYIDYGTDTKYEVDVYVYDYAVTTTTEDSDATTTHKYLPGFILIKKMVQTESSENGSIVYSWDYASENAKPDACNFTNTINVNTVVIKKTVVGESYYADESFDFYVRIPSGGTTITLEKDSYITAGIYDSTTGDLISTNNIKVVDGEKGAAVDSLDSTNAQLVQLKAGQELRITGAPVSMIYFVSEDSKYTKDEGYTQTYSYTEEGSRTTDTTKNNCTNKPAVNHNTDTGTYSSIVVSGTTNTTTNLVEFTNTRNINIETGVNVEVLPFALVLVIAGCGAALYLSNKKRNEDR